MRPPLLRPSATIRDWSPSLAFAAILATLVLYLAMRRGEFPIEVLIELLLCLCAGLSGPFPVIAGWVTMALLSGLSWIPNITGLSAYAALIPILSAAVARRPRLRLAMATSALALLVLLSYRRLPPSESLLDYVVFWLAWVAGAWVAGSLIRTMLDAAARASEDRLNEARREIARELHDTVAHDLSLIVMRAEQSRLRGQTTADDLAFIVGSADRSIRDLRGMLTLLRVDTRSSTDSGSLVTYSLDDALRGAVDDLKASGFEASVSVEGGTSDLPKAVDETLARVLREAASNVVLHGARGSECGILVAVDNDSAELVVTSVPGQARIRPRLHQPLGLAGLRERVEAIGGEFSAGLGARRWILRAQLPLR